MEAIEEQPLEAGHTLSDEAFYDFCQRNSDLRFERESDGRILITPFSGGTIGNINAIINALFFSWLEETKSESTHGGEMFDSSTAFRLPDGSTRSPDVAWVQIDHWNALSDREQEQFPPLCPDFVVELLSPTDVLKTTKAKMLDVWMQNGCRLAWLIDPKAQTTHIFRANGEIQLISGFDKTLSGEEVLVGFTLTLSRLL